MRRLLRYAPPLSAVRRASLFDLASPAAASAPPTGKPSPSRVSHPSVLEGTSGGGVVKAYVNGNQELQAIKIDAAAVDPEDVETLEDLVTTAVRQALQAAKELRDKETAKVTGGMNLPGLGF